MNIKGYRHKGYFTISVLTATLLLAACSGGNLIDNDIADDLLNDGSITICHATGDAANPYEEVSVDLGELIEHSGHENDIIPAPEEGCPPELVVDANDGKITICHATASAENPYVAITIDFNGLHGHGGHVDDIIPAPEEGCPSEAVEMVEEDGSGKITICHATGSAKNPYVNITIDINGLHGHDRHAGDIIPAPAGGCPTTRENGSGNRP
jgi:hypothetical protein